MASGPLNYYIYTDDAGVQWSVRMTEPVAMFVLGIPAYGQPRLPGRIRSRKMRLADYVTGKELLVIAPYKWPLNLGAVEAYGAGIYIVQAYLQEDYPLEKP